MGRHPLDSRYVIDIGELISRAIFCDLQLLLKSVRVRNGLALLEPSNVELKGWQNEDMQANQDQEFVRNLRRRMGFVFRSLHLSSLI